MHHYISDRQNLLTWISHLHADYEVFGPVRGKDHLVRFQKVTCPDEIEWHYTGSIIPPKKYFLPTEEILFTFKDGVTKVNHDVMKMSLILGLHPCDLHSLQMLDFSMGDGFRDKNYFSRREHTVLVGVNCIPDESCFCNCLGTSNPPAEGVDIFLTFIDQRVYVEPKSGKGLALLEHLPNKERITLEEQRMRDMFTRKRNDAFASHFKANDGELNGLLESAADHPQWLGLSQRCLSCSACTAVCPTCFCFDVWDETNLDGSEGQRVRRWDSCQIQSFTQVASGEVFRKSRAERVRHRFFRKFVYLRQRYGMNFCVGCGRCARACPVKISIPEVLRSLSTSDASKEN